MAARSGPLRLIPSNVQEEAPAQARGEKGGAVGLHAGQILSAAAVRAGRENLAYGGFDPLPQRSSKAAVVGHKGPVKGYTAIRKAVVPPVAGGIKRVPRAVFVEGRKAAEAVAVACGDDDEAQAAGQEYEAKGAFAKEDLELRATLPQWVLDLIDGDTNVPGLEISNRRSDFCEEGEDEGPMVGCPIKREVDEEDASFIKDLETSKAVAGGDSDEALAVEKKCEAKEGLAEEDIEFRATLPKWVVDLIDADINIPGLEISYRRSDFYEDGEGEGEDEGGMEGCPIKREVDEADASFIKDLRTSKAVAGGDSDEALAVEKKCEAKGGLAEEDIEFRATLPQWVVDLIDADINIPGLEISNRRSDFYEDGSEEELEEEEIVPGLDTN